MTAGGLATNFRSLRANILLSTAVAVTGIAFPIALSFSLLSLTNATPIQAFAAGAALCSTSLGTTFTVLATSGLSETRLGTVLSSAAIMDDVVGLAMVQVISNLGQSTTSFDVVTVIRSVAVSFGLAVAVPVFCRVFVWPGTVLLNGYLLSRPEGIVEKVCRGTHSAFVTHTLILLGLVAGASYAGTSNLFAAYLAGASISWWDSELPHPLSCTASSGSNVESIALQPKYPVLPHDQEITPSAMNHAQSQERPSKQKGSLQPISKAESNPSRTALSRVYEPQESKSNAIYDKYYAASVRRILKPLFFVSELSNNTLSTLIWCKASIGFAIPISKMFNREILWHGIVYAILMFFGKFLTGLWLVCLSLPSWKPIIPKGLRSLACSSCTGVTRKSPAEGVRTIESHVLQTQAVPAKSSDTGAPTVSAIPRPVPQSPVEKIKKPLSLYPAAMIGTAMTARGEIGFLIASIAETNGFFTSSGPTATPHGDSSEIYLVVVWAIVLCTIVGPLGVGLLVKRVRKLQREREDIPDRVDPLGVWTVK